ncbi:MAG: tRNA1(Val) (adenine(37)-N6)-methyltransferase [Bacteroidota bacterium]|jgi:tRNA1Val (adenine37-N6)-methyltransferase
MSNTQFNFKQFSVQQDLCSMKVGTDGVLLGSWTYTDNANNILDIGTGTGLIALMLAQRSNANITAVDAEANACEQAKINFDASPWTNRLQLVHSKIQDFHSDHLFDLIVSNPPYFSGYYSSENLSRDIARSADVLLPYEELISCAKKLLIANGRLSLILPADQQEKITAIANQNELALSRLTFVKTKSSKEAKRILLEFVNNFNQVNAIIDELIIQSDDNGRVYTQEYINLTKDFYLAF